MKLLINFMTSVMLCLAIAGCSSKDSKFYILYPTHLKNLQSYQSCRKIIMIENVSIPEYLDKPQIVTRIHPNQLLEAEFHRWGEPLSANITSVIAQNLSSQLKRDYVFTPPIINIPNANYYLQVKIKRFDVDSAGRSILTANWSIYNKRRALILSRDSTSCLHTNYPNSYSHVTIVMNKNITALSREIANQLKKFGCRR